jgi:magnesium transporter
MVSTYKTQQKIIWIDLENPTREEVRAIMEEYAINPEIAEDILDPTIRSRIDIFKDMSYFVFHFPLHTHKKHKAFNKKSEELDFIISKNFLITVHYSPIDTLVSFSKSFEADTLLHNNKIVKNTGSLFAHLLYRMYTAVQEKIEDIQTTLTAYEEEIFSGKEKEMVFELSAINRVLIYFRDSMMTHKRILRAVEQTGLDMFGKEFEIYIEQITHEYNKVERLISITKDYADELRETNNSLLSTKQNEVMKLLAIISFVTFPLTLISSIFGMNTQYLPIVGYKYDFGVVLSIMALTALFLFIFFKKKNWL